MRASSESLCASSREGTTPEMVLAARSLKAAIFAPERPALRSAGLRIFRTCWGVGARPFEPRALMRAKMVDAALPEMDW